MPLRVAAAPDGGFEIIDGFKRLMAWQGEGRKEVPAVVEPVEEVIAAPVAAAADDKKGKKKK